MNARIVKLVVHGGMAAAALLGAASAVTAQVIHPETGELHPASGAGGDLFGRAVDLSEDWIAAGAPGAAGNDGAVFLYDRRREQAEVRIDPPLPGLGAQFGHALALEGDRLVVSEPHYAAGQGRVLVHRFVGGSWQLEQELHGDSPADFFGKSIDLDLGSGQMIVGAGPAWSQGSASVYRQLGSSWEYAGELSHPGELEDRFGESCRIVAGQCAVGAPGDDDGRGAVYVYEGAGQDWELVATLCPARVDEDEFFGAAVGLEPGVLFAGCPRYDEDQPDAGAVWRYERGGGGLWSPVEVMTSRLASPDDRFGGRLDVDGDVLVVASRLLRTGQAPAAAALVQFRRQGSSWVEQQVLVQDAPQSGDSFGLGCAVGSDAVVGGAPFHHGADTISGSLFCFDLPAFSLDVDPPRPSFGESVRLEGGGGAPGAPLALFLTELGGVPTKRLLRVGALDAEGRLSLSAAYQDPSLVGLSLRLIGYGPDASSTLQLSNEVAVEF